MSLLTNLLLPSGIAYALFGLGLLACATSRTKRLSWWFLAGSGAVTLIFSSGFVAAGLIGPLEYSRPTLTSPDQRTDVRHIVILTAWGSDDKNLPLTGRLNASSLYRVLLALELYQARPDCDVIISGNSVTTRLMGQVLREFGVPEGAIRLEDESPSTADSATKIGKFVRDEPFFLVTSAGHMPRAIGALEKQGLEPVAAPTDHQFPSDWRRAGAAPRPMALTVSDLAVHEMLGWLWYRLRGRA